MRTTISMDDQLGLEVRRRAAAAGLSVSAYIARVLRDAVTRQDDIEEEVPPFHLVTVSGEGPVHGVDLDRTGALLAAEDVVRYGPKGR